MFENESIKKTLNIKSLKTQWLRDSEIKAFEPFILETDRISYIIMKGKVEMEECDHDGAVILSDNARVKITGSDIQLVEISDSYIELSGKLSEINFE